MKPLFLLFIAHFTVIGLVPVQAQSGREKKFQQAIEALNNTAFIKKYQEYKNRMEENSRGFKSQSDAYDAQGVKDVAAAYENSRAQFDKILESLKKDLLDETSRKFMVSNPDRYTDYISKELEFAMKSYDANVTPMMAQVSGVESVGFGFFELKMLFDLVFSTIEVVKGINKELDKMDEGYLDENFVKPLRVTAWDNL